MVSSRLVGILERNEGELLSDWIALQNHTQAGQRDRVSDTQMQAHSHDFVMELRQALQRAGSTDIHTAEWSRLRDMLGSLSRQRAVQGFTPTETAAFVFSFKQVLFLRLRAELEKDPGAFSQELWAATELLDRLGLYTFEVFQKGREEVVNRQQQEMLELSTPVVELWHGILGLPLIGTLDSNRTQVVMQNLLEALVARSATLAIIDITGVPTVDTLVAQHLLKTVAAARLMGADCIISGIRPQIAQTIIHLGVDLAGVTTKATMADAFRLALQKRNLTITKV